MKEKKRRVFQQSLALLLCGLMMAPSTLPLPIYGEEVVKEVEKEEIGEQSNHLTDYSEMYGYEPIDETSNLTIKPKKGRSAAPQKIAYIAVFIEFKDMDDVRLDDESSLKAADMVLNTGGDTIIGSMSYPTKSLQSYLKKFSYGQVEVAGSVFPKQDGKVVSYTTEKPREYFKKYDPVTNPIGYSGYAQQREREEELIEGALRAVKPSIESSFTPEELDSDGNKTIDAISFFAEAPTYVTGVGNGGDDVAWNDLLWSHKSSFYTPIQIHGKSMDSYNLIQTRDPKGLGSEFSHIVRDGEVILNNATYGVIHHEFLHTLGLPDLYRGYASGSPVGFYDIMADSGGNNPVGMLSILQRQWLKWGSKLEEVKSTKTITLKRPKYTDSSEQYAVKVFSPFNTDEYFVMEFFEKPPAQVSITGRSDGVIAYRINSTLTSNINGTDDGLNDYMYVFRPGEKKLGEAKGNLSNAVILPTIGNTYGSTDLLTDDWDSNSLFFSNGTNSGIQIKVVDKTADEISLEITVPKVEGTGTVNDPYLLSKTSDFRLLSKNPKAHYKLMNDIDFEGVSFQSINSLRGSLDGNHKKLSNITINEGKGLFNELDYGSSLKNLELVNINVTHTGDSHAGVLAGVIAGNVNNVVISSGSITTSGQGDYELQGTGGFAGTAIDSARIEDCYTSAIVNGGKNSGGFVGLNQGARYKDCFANGLVQTAGKQGGFFGTVYSTGTGSDSVLNCAFDMRATGQEKAHSGDETIAGINGYDINENVALDITEKNEELIAIIIKPLLTEFESTVDFDETGIASFDKATSIISGLQAGKTIMNTNIQIGTHRMSLKTKVEVTGVDESIPIQSVTLDKEELDLDKGSTSALTAVINPSDTSDDKTLTWTSSDDEVVVVDETGKLEAKDAGDAVITVTTSNGKTATCKVTVVGNIIPIRSVRLEKTYFTMNIGDEESLEATVSPSNATDSNEFTWTSSNEEVATVDETGKITAISAGTTTITVTTTNGKRSTCRVTVKSPILSIVLDKTKLELDVKKFETLTATINPSTTTDSKTLTWSSSNTKVAIVDRYGKVTAIAPGSAEITVTSTNKVSATCEVTVKRVPISSISFNKEALRMDIGTSEALSTVFNPIDTTDDKKITWTTSDEEIALVDKNGKVKAIANGKATITGTTVNGKSATCEVEVIIPISSVILEKRNLTMNIGEAEIFKATTSPSNATDGDILNWTSSNEEVAIVDEAGKVTAISQGTAKITVTTENGRLAVCSVVVKSPIVSLTLDKMKVELDVQQSETLTATINPSDTTDSKTLTWASSNTKVAIVDRYGKVTAIAPGSAKVTVTSANKVSATCDVTVKRVAISSISFNKEALRLNIGASETLGTVFNPIDTTDDKTITWTTSNEKVATVDKYGKVRAVASGRATITGTTVNGKSAICEVTTIVPISSVSLERALTMNIGGAKTFVATVSPSNAADSDKFTWETSNEEVATVDETGKVTAISEGAAVITVTTSNGKKSTCRVTVKNSIVSLTLDKMKVELDVQQSETLTATINPSDTTDSKTLTWASSNTKVAIVDRYGKVTAIAPGSAEITVTSANKVSATCDVTVKRVAISSISFNKEVLRLGVGASETLGTVFNPIDTTDDKTITWTTSNEKVVTVDKYGKVKGVAIGSATITGTSVNGKSAICEVEVIIPISSVRLEQRNLTMNIGAAETFVATVSPSNAADGDNFTWTSSNEEVATVDVKGKVTAISQGTAKITVTTANGKTAYCSVSVKSPILSIDLDKKKLELDVRQKETLTATINPSTTTDSKTLTWSSSNTKVASVDRYGNVTVIAPGTAEITVTSTNKVSETCEVNVKRVPINSISFNKEALRLGVGASETLGAIFNPIDTTDDKTITWATSNEKIATVDKYGKVKAIASGRATITGTTVNGKSAICEVEVIVLISSVILEQRNLTMNIGDAKTFVATVSPSNAADGDHFTWTSSNEEVATVDVKGKVTAISQGTAKITVTTANGKTAYCSVSVKSPILSIDLDKKKLELDVRQKETLTATINPSTTTDSKTLTWSSSNTKVASVDRYGNVTAIAPGTAEITVTSANKVSTTCDVIVRSEASFVAGMSNGLYNNIMQIMVDAQGNGKK